MRFYHIQEKIKIKNVKDEHRKSWKSKKVQPLLNINSTGKKNINAKWYFSIDISRTLHIFPIPAKPREGHQPALPSPGHFCILPFSFKSHGRWAVSCIVQLRGDNVPYFSPRVRSNIFLLSTDFSFWPDGTCQETTRVLTISGWVNIQTLCSWKVLSRFPDVAANRS